MSGAVRAAFLDRDGTLMDDSGFIGDPARISVLPGVPEALRALAAAGYARIVVTNQSGVARGMFGEPDVRRVNAALSQMLAAEGAEIDAFYFCTHLYGCDCRKPLTGMVDRAVADHNIELDGSVLFGDRDSDIALARAAGITAVLVNAPAGYSGPPPDYRAPSLAQGVDAFLRHVHA